MLRLLKIGVATGQHSFAHEQAQLVDEQDKAYVLSLRLNAHTLKVPFLSIDYLVSFCP